VVEEEDVGEVKRRLRRRRRRMRRIAAFGVKLGPGEARRHKYIKCISEPPAESEAEGRRGGAVRVVSKP